MISRIKNLLNTFKTKSDYHDDKLKLNIGLILSKINEDKKYKNINDYEYKVFSQWGEDGIIDFLCNNIKIENKIFIEFGVEDYKESNTRFLLLKNNWQGLILDSSQENIDKIKKDNIYWRHTINAQKKFVTKENINEIIIENKIDKNIGLLSIDIDGNDYWIWKELNVINPSIVIIEYNFRFGKDKSCTIPYDPNFVREKKHSSSIYYGASLKALTKLGKQKGYSLVCCNSNGNNAFFVRNDLLNDVIKEASIELAFKNGKFRESRDEKGNLLFLNNKQENKILNELPVEEV